MSGIPEVPKSMRTCGNCNQGQDADEAYCREDGCDGLDWTERLSDFRARAEAVIADLKKRVAASDREVEQTLGKALGYAPTFPEASRVEDGQVNVGEHVPTTIAQAAANRIAELTKERDEAQVIVKKFEKLYLARELDEEERERDYNAGLVATLTKERDAIQHTSDEQTKRIGEIGTALGMTPHMSGRSHYYAGAVIEDARRLRGELAAMREALKRTRQAFVEEADCVRRGCGAQTKIVSIVVDALTSDAGKPEANVIAAALDDFHPDSLGDIAYDLNMTTGAEGHEDAILAYLKTLPTAEAVACLNGATR